MNVSDASRNGKSLGRRIFAQGWFWTVLVVPTLYWLLVLELRLLSRSAFLDFSLVVGALGALLLMVWKLAARGELFFQVASFMFNAVFIAYFISLATR